MYLRSGLKMLVKEQNPIVDVVVTCYNATHFIEAAIQGILIQEGNLIRQIIIIDDASEDDTAEKLNTALAGCNIPFQIIVHENNVGSFASLKEAVSMVRAPFVAILEGDDYWTDSSKIRRQAESLITNSLFTGTAHRANVVDAEGRDSGKFIGADTNQIFTLKDLTGVPPFQLSSLMYRRSVIQKLPLQFEGTVSNDKLINILLGISGPVHYVKDVMSSYRDHSGGIHNKTDVHEQFRLQVLFYEKAGTLLPKETNPLLDEAKWIHISGYLHSCAKQKVKPKISLSYLFKQWFKTRKWNVDGLRSLGYHLKMYFRL